MKILIVNHFPLEGSGSGTYTKNLALHLAKRGHKISIIFPENIAPKELGGGIRLRPVYFSGDKGAPAIEGALPFNFPCFTTHPRSITTFADLTGEELAAYTKAFEDAIAEEIRDFEPDIIHAQHIWILSGLAARSSVPTVVTAHGTDLMGYDKWEDFRAFADEAVEKCDKIISISKDNYNKAIETFPKAIEYTQILSNGYDEDMFYPEVKERAILLAQHGVSDNGERLVIFVGKLAHFKGVDVLLHAVQKYEADPANNIITLIVGSGEEEEKLKTLAKDLKLRNLHFLGHKSQEELRKLYSVADVFAMPSRREPFGLVALEALACGAPVVATRSGGLVDFIKDDVGLLVNQDDPEELCMAILTMLSRMEEQPGLRQKTAKYAREGFSQSSFVMKLEKIYDKVLNDREK